MEAVFTLQGWLDNSVPNRNVPFDMAACLVTEPFDAAEPPLAFVVNPLPALQFAAIGYPGKRIPNHPFNGKRMWQSLGAMNSASGGTIWAENDFTAGASGAPWCAPQEDWVVRGLTSSRNNDPNLAASPAFAEGFQNLYNAVKDFTQL